VEVAIVKKKRMEPIGTYLACLPKNEFRIRSQLEQSRLEVAVPLRPILLIIIKDSKEPTAMEEGSVHEGK